MRLLRYLRPRAALLDELETLRLENARLREERDMWQLISWIRRTPAVPRRADPHPVQLGRHHRAEDRTEFFPRRQR